MRGSRVDRLRSPVLTAVAVGGVSLALHLRDPHDTGSWGLCPWLALTGRYCPGCGALRAVNDLTRGDLAAAASSNLLFVAAVPVLVWAWLRWTRAAWTGGSNAPPAWVSTHPRTVYAVAAVVAIVFTVLRNLSGSWLAP